MIYALMGLLGFGLADFFVVYLTKFTDALKGMFWNTVFMTLWLLILTIVIGNPSALFHLGIADYIIGFTAGIITTIGGLAFYKGARLGNISILSPIGSSYSVLVILFSVLFRAESLNSIQFASIFSVIIGTILISTNLKKIMNLNLALTDKAVPYGIAAMLCWGSSFILIGDLSLKIGWLETINLTTVSGLVVLFFMMWIRKKKFGIEKKPAYLLAALLGILSTMGYLGYSLGVGSVYASIVAPVVAAAPSVTIILALIFLKEKLLLEQKIGVLILISGMMGLAI